MTPISFSDHIRIKLAWMRQAMPSQSTGNDPWTLVFPDHRIAYIPIPKAGNSSIRAALLPLLGLAPSDIQHIQDYRGFQKMHYSEFKAMRQGDWFVFSVVREPFSRYASAYLDKIVTREKLLRAFRRMGMRRGDSFERFLTLLSQWPQLALNDHVASQELMLREASHDGASVYKLENLTRDWPVIAETIKARSNIDVADLERRNKGKATTPWQSLYCANTVALTLKLGAEDFAKFGYDQERLS